MNGIGSSHKKSDPTDLINIIPPKIIINYEVFIIQPNNNHTDNNFEESNLIDFETDVSCSQTNDLSQLSNRENKKELSVIDLFEDISVGPQTLQLQKKSIDEVIFDPLELKSLTNDDESITKATDHNTYTVLKDVDKYYEHAPTTSTTIHYLDLWDSKRNDPDDEDLIDELLSDLAIYKGVNNHSKKNNTKDLDVPKLIKTEKEILVPKDQKKNVIKDVGVTPTINKETKKTLSNADYEIPKIIRTETKVSLPFDNKPALNNLSVTQKNNRIENTKQIFGIPKLLRAETQASVFSDIKRDLPKNVGPRKINNVDGLNLGNLAQIIIPNFNQTLRQSVSRDDIKQYIDNLLNSKTVFSNVLKYYNPIDFYATSHINGYEFVVDTIQMDKKKYRKNRIIVEDSEAAKYTNGPSLDEKKLLLPQIMDRLVEKKKRLDRYAHCKRKLVLDCGSRRTQIPVQFSPCVLSEDCNKERLKNFMMRRSFDNFVRTGQK